MLKYFLILFFSLALNKNVVCQRNVDKLNMDSLKKVLLIARGIERVNTMNLLSKRILYGRHDDKDIDTAERAIKEAIALSKELQYDKGMGSALLNQAIFISFIRYTSTNYNTVLSIVQTALPLLKQSGDLHLVANCYAVTGSCYHNLGENNRAITYYDSGIHLFQQIRDTGASVWQIIDKAHSYSDLSNYSASYKTFHEAQQLIAPTDTSLLNYTYGQLAQLFVYANLPELAIEYMNKVRAFFPDTAPVNWGKMPWPVPWVLRVGGEAYLQLHQIDSALKIASCINISFKDQDPPDNLFYGHLYAAMGQYEKAVIYFSHGYSVSQSNSYEIGHALHANGLASSYFNLKNFPQAIYYANEAIKISKQRHFLAEEKNANGILGNIYAAKKDYAKAYYHNQLYKSLNDSLAPEEYKRRLSLIQVRDQLEIQKKEAQLLSNQNQISQQQIKIQESSLKRRSLLLYIFISALLLMGLMVILVNRNVKLKRRKTELLQLMEQVNAQQKLTELEKEKNNLEMQALRAQMNPHFIFNCLSSINRFILINKVDEASDYLTKFSRLIRMALHNSEKSLITLDSELEALRLYLDLERLRFKNAFNYSITFINTIDVNTVYIPPMLIQPFVENAIWHGLMHKKGIGCLDIQLSAADKTLTCAIVDNGIGRNMAASLNSRSAEKNKSMGVEITAGRLALLNKSKNEEGVFNIEDLFDDDGNGCGTRVILKMPYRDLTEVVA